MRRIAVGLVTLVLLAGCTDDPTVTEFRSQSTLTTETIIESTVGTDPEPTAAPTVDTPVAATDGLFPTVVDATASSTDGQAWRFDVTLLSEYDSPARYADAWRVLDADDNELGIRVLTHDHAGEQPFTRSSTIDIAGDVAAVWVEGRDQLNGWSGERFEVMLDR